MNKQKTLISVLLLFVLISSCNNIDKQNYLSVGDTEIGIYRCYEIENDFSFKSFIKDKFNLQDSEFYIEDSAVQNIYNQVIASNSNLYKKFNEFGERDNTVYFDLCVNIETNNIYFSVANNIIHKDKETEDYYFNIILPAIKKHISKDGSYILRQTLKILDAPMTINTKVYHKLNNLQYDEKVYTINIQNALIENVDLTNIE
jgi:hypothetical protein